MCDKIFWVWEVCQGIYVLNTFWGVAVSAVWAAGVALVSILQAGDWVGVSAPARHYFSTYIYHISAP